MKFAKHDIVISKHSGRIVCVTMPELDGFEGVVVFAPADIKNLDHFWEFNNEAFTKLL